MMMLGKRDVYCPIFDEHCWRAGDNEKGVPRCAWYDTGRYQCGILSVGGVVTTLGAIRCALTRLTDIMEQRKVEENEDV